jgi:Zn-dependent protease
MPSTGSIKLFTIFGIRIGVDFSWFIVLFLYIFLLSDYFNSVLAGSQTEAYVVSVVSALLFFVSLILHELGHAVVARKLGLEITGIDLWFFGGVAKLGRDADRPRTEFWVAIAGPLVTVLVIGVCIGLGALVSTSGDLFGAATLETGETVSPATVVLGWLAFINVLLLAFNMIPAFPLDGGRIARAIAWKVTGDRGKATRFAATLGQGFGYLLIGAGLVWFFTEGGFSGLWFIVLGFFLSSAARQASRQSRVTDRLEGIRIADIMDAQPVSIPADLPIERANDEYFLRYRWPWFPVVDELGRFIGLVHEQAVDAAFAAGRTGTVRDLVDQGESYGVPADAPIEALLGSEPLQRLGALMAVDRDGVLRGVVTIEQVRRALYAATARPAN